MEVCQKLKVGYSYDTGMQLQGIHLHEFKLTKEIPAHLYLLQHSRNSQEMEGNSLDANIQTNEYRKCRAHTQQSFIQF